MHRWNYAQFATALLCAVDLVVEVEFNLRVKISIITTMDPAKSTKSKKGAVLAVNRNLAADQVPKALDLIISQLRNCFSSFFTS